MSSSFASIQERIHLLPPLPDSLLRIQVICHDTQAGIKDLVKVVNKDPSLTANILKFANSPYFARMTKICSLDQAVAYFGMATVHGFALSAAVKRNLEMDFSPYGIGSETFAKASELQSLLLKTWLGGAEQEMMEILLPSAFISRIGMIPIAAYISAGNKLKDSFKTSLRQVNTQKEVYLLESEFTGCPTPQASADIFEHWNFHPLMVKAVQGSLAPEKMDEEDKRYAMAIKCVQDVIFFDATVNIDYTEKVLENSQEYGLHPQLLEQAINKIQAIGNKGL